RSLAKKAQSRSRKEEARGTRLGRQLAILRKVRTQLANKLEKEQTNASESKRRVKQLETSAARNETQFERVKLELERQVAALNSGYNSLDAARVGRTLVNSFRSQMRMPAENLMQSIQGLLNSPLPPEQKQLVDTAHQ